MNEDRFKETLLFPLGLVLLVWVMSTCEVKARDNQFEYSSSSSTSASLDAEKHGAALAIFFQVSQSTIASFSRTFKAMYSRHNIYALHFDKRISESEVDDCLKRIQSNIFPTTGRAESTDHEIRMPFNVFLVSDREYVTPDGISMVLSFLQAAELLLGKDSEWTHFINLEPYFFPLVHMDHLGVILSQYPNYTFTRFNPVDPTAPSRYLRNLAQLHIDASVFGLPSNLQSVNNGDGKLPFLVRQDMQVRHGESWGIWSRQTVSKMFDNVEARLWLSRLSIIRNPSEFFFHSIIANRPELMSKTINDNMCYVANMDQPVSLAELEQTGALFVRELGPDGSGEMLAEIERRLWHDSEYIRKVEARIKNHIELSTLVSEVPHLPRTSDRRWFNTTASLQGAAALVQSTPSISDERLDELLNDRSNRVDIAFFVQISEANLGMLPRMFKAIWDTRHLYCLHFDKNIKDSEVREVLDTIQKGMFPEIAAASDSSHEIALPRNVLLAERYYISWGGISMVQNFLQAVDMLLAANLQWTHLINLSPTNFPLVTIDALSLVLSQYPHHTFSRFFMRRDVVPAFVHLRLVREFFVDPALYDYRSSVHGINTSTQIKQLFVHIWDRLERGEFWGIWSRKSVEAMAYGHQARLWLTRLTTQMNVDEFYFHTIVFNNPKLLAHTIQDAMLYVAWSHPQRTVKRKSNHPFLLTEPKHFWRRIKSSGALFARKFHAESSRELLDMIEERLWNSSVYLRSVLDRIAKTPAYPS